MLRRCRAMLSQKTSTVGGMSASDFSLRPPRHLGFAIVPQGEEFVVERLGKFSRTLKPGMHFPLVPGVDRIRYRFSTKEQPIVVPAQAVSRDNVVLGVDGILFLRIVDAHAASYNVESAVIASVNIAQTSMRAQIGKLSLDRLFEERESLNANIVESIRREVTSFGIEVTRYEVRDVSVSENVRHALDLQAAAERKRRELVLRSEGEMTARINNAKGERESQEQLALAAKFTQVTAAEAGSEALLKSTDAVTASLEKIAKTMAKDGAAAREAVSFRLAEQYIEAFGNIAKKGNTVVLSQPAGDAGQMVTQAMSLYKALGTSGGGGGADASSSASSAGGGANQGGS